MSKWSNKNKKYYSANKEAILQKSKERYILNKEIKNEQVREYRKTNPLTILLKSARYRANKKGIAFNLTKEDLVVPKVCPLLGIKLESQIGKGYAKDNSPTLDRLDPSKGYVKGNVWIISMKANRIKNDATLEEIKTLVENWSRLL
jgi:hypothetical protein